MGSVTTAGVLALTCSVSFDAKEVMTSQFLFYS